MQTRTSTLKTSLIRHVAAAAASCLALFAMPSLANANSVLNWDDIAVETLNTVWGQFNPALQTYDLPIISIAVHDAVNSITQKYNQYTYFGHNPGANVDAAVAAAAHDTLIALLPPGTTDGVETAYEDALLQIPNGAAKTQGIAAGQAAAAAILTDRATDNIQGALFAPYVVGPPDPGVYQITELGFVLAAGVGDTRPFGISSITPYVPGPPPSLTGAVYTADYNAVKSLGSATSTTRSQTQTVTGLFWYNAAVREWHVAARAGLTDNGSDASDSARLLALLSISHWDSIIASMNSKFKYNFWRPVTAIHAAGTDGNPNTAPDPNWAALCLAPPFPEYAAAHGAASGVTGYLLPAELGDHHTFTVESVFMALIGQPTSRTYTSYAAASAEQAMSRVYCGIHFPSSLVTGAAQGAAIAAYVRSNLLTKRH